MTKAPSGHSGIGYRHVDSITVDDHPPYVSPQEINPRANAQWVLIDLINMAQFLEPYGNITDVGRHEEHRGVTNTGGKPLSSFINRYQSLLIDAGNSFAELPILKLKLKLVLRNI
ncbi:hypothetical protein B0H17DRAFT_1146170 [Mycena rosella]|uniref:Uncharacterized protein n=1 Tax=Mycena rosella TaxID=1033263 RepID=A0AAD7CQ61_MYCRO|nr:hypothetical protein B0H17DRAFT_1146170 [Mycena rosella]